MCSSGNRTPGSRFYSDLLDTLQTWFAFTYSYSSVVKACNCRRLAYGSFQLTHVSRDDHAVELIEPWRQDEDKTLLQRSQRCHKGEFRQVSISARQRSLRCGQNLHGPVLRATLLMTVGSCAQAMADTGDKRAYNSTTKVSFCTIIIRLCHCMIAITMV